MNTKTLGVTEVVAGVVLAVLTLASPGARLELYIVAAALFISGHVVLAATWHRKSNPTPHEEAQGVGERMSRQSS